MTPRVVLTVALLALFPLTAVLDRFTPTPPNVVQTLPPRSVLPVLASGHRETLAAFLEMRAVAHVLRTMEPGQFSDEDRDHLFLLYEGIMTLDPDDAAAAARGSVLMSAYGWRADTSLEILLMARGEPYTFQGVTRQQRSANPAHPDYWRLWFEEAAIYLSMRANEVQSDESRAAWVRKAGRAWVLAADHGAPRGLREPGERLARRGLDRAGLLEREQEVWEARLASSPEEGRPQIEGRIKALTSLRMAIALSEHPQVKPLLDALARRRVGLPDIRALKLDFPPELLVPPSGGAFRVVSGQVVSAEAEAFLVQQTLGKALLRWRNANPDSTPTLLDLGWWVPPYRGSFPASPIFQAMGWSPVAIPPKGLSERAPKLPSTPWWELLEEPEVHSAFGLRPVGYLRYWIEGDRVRVVVAD